MSKKPTRPEYHAFAAVFAEIGSAIQGSGPTREAALEEAGRGLGSTDGLEVYPVGPRLAALLALGSYETTTPFEIERRMSAPTRLELRLVGEEDEALADVRAAYATGRGLWAGRDWDDADRICPDWTDEQIARYARAAAAEGARVEVTRWGIPDDGSREVQRWLERRDAAARRLLAAIQAGGDALAFDARGVAVLAPEVDVDRLPEDQIAAARDVSIACDDLRELAQESDAVVEEDAAAAETAAREALEAVLAGDADAATSCAEEAAHCERRYGDAPTWGALRDAVQRWAELRATEEAA